MTAAKKGPVGTVFDSQRTAFIWAFHVARASRTKTRVAKVEGCWRAWKQS